MSKFSTHHKKEFKRPYKIHPIWRGIGFLMMIIVPVVAWFAGEELTLWAMESESPQVQIFMRAMSSPFGFPTWVYSIPILDDLARWIRSIDFLKVKLLFFFLLVIISSGILSVIYAMIYQATVPRYTPLDEPAPKIRPKKYTR